jgi:uncharacterized membrane protein YebE (DUF533 family)
MNPQDLLQQFLGPDVGKKADGALRSAKDGLATSGVAGIAGGVAAGGLLGLMLGNNKARKKVGKMAGGVAGYGGAAALGALAYRAYQNWQGGQQAPQSVPPAPPTAEVGALPTPSADSKFLPASAPASDGKPFELALVIAMIGAANADGHIDADEQRQIFERVGEMPLDAENKAFIFDLLGNPPSLQDIAGLAAGQEQAAELYLASRLAIDADHPAELAYLEALASRLSLPAELVQHLEEQVAAATA